MHTHILDLHKDAIYCFEQILEVGSCKIAMPGV